MSEKTIHRLSYAAFAVGMACALPFVVMVFMATIMPGPATSYGACNPQATNDFSCCYSNVTTNCLDAGELTGSATNDNEVCTDGSNEVEIIFTAEVFDSGGSGEVVTIWYPISGTGYTGACPPNSSNPIPLPSTTSATWIISGPENFSTNGDGLRANAFVTNGGTYDCVFTVTVSRALESCSPTNLPLTSSCVVCEGAIEPPDRFCDQGVHSNSHGFVVTLDPDECRPGTFKIKASPESGACALIHEADGVVYAPPVSEVYIDNARVEITATGTVAGIGAIAVLESSKGECTTQLFDVVTLDDMSLAGVDCTCQTNPAVDSSEDDSDPSATVAAGGLCELMQPRKDDSVEMYISLDRTPFPEHGDDMKWKFTHSNSGWSPGNGNFGEHKTKLVSWSPCEARRDTCQTWFDCETGGVRASNEPKRQLDVEVVFFEHITVTNTEILKVGLIQPEDEWAAKIGTKDPTNRVMLWCEDSDADTGDDYSGDGDRSGIKDYRIELTVRDDMHTCVEEIARIFTGCECKTCAGGIVHERVDHSGVHCAMSLGSAVMWFDGEYDPATGKIINMDNFIWPRTRLLNDKPMKYTWPDHMETDVSSDGEHIVHFKTDETEADLAEVASGGVDLTITPTSGSLRTYEFRPTTPAGGGSGFSITVKVGGTVYEVREYEVVEVDGVRTWVRKLGEGAVTETIESSWDGTYRNVLRTLSNGEGEVASIVGEKLFPYAWGMETVESVDDPDGAALKTSWQYYTNPVATGSYSRLKSVVQPDGSWVQFGYTEDGRPAWEKSGFKDAPFDDPGDDIKLTEYSYALHAGETDGLAPRSPRTVTRKVKGIVTGKTFRHYSIGPDEEFVVVTEQAPSQTSSYGDAGNLRSVTRRYPGDYENTAAAGKVWKSEQPDGRLSTYVYEYGSYVTNGTPGDITFTTNDAVTSFIRVTVTNGTTSAPGGVAGRTTRAIRIENSFEDTLYQQTDALLAGGYRRIEWAQHLLNADRKVVRTDRSDGTVTETGWGCCDKEWDRGSDGAETSYLYDDAHRLHVVTKQGVSNAFLEVANRVEVYYYDAAGQRVTSTVPGQFASTNSYDLAGRLQWSTDGAGLSNSYFYSADGLVTTNVAPGGLTSVTVKYIDGRTKYVKVNGTYRTTYDYGVNADGSQWTATCTGPLGDASPMWVTNTVDLLGRTIREERPGFGEGVVLTNASFYKSNGKLDHATITGSPITFYQYDDVGDQVRTVVDSDGSETAELDGGDRVSESVTWYEEDAEGDVWRVSASAVYATEGSDAATTTSVSRTRLTGLGGEAAMPAGGSGVLAAEALAVDIHNNTNVSRRIVDRDNGLAVQLSDSWDSTVDAWTLSVNGLNVSNVTRTGVGYGYAYDEYSWRQTGVTDPRTGTSVTHYNGKGQVDWVMDAAANKTWYAYDPDTGRRVAVTNALGEVAYSEHDAEGRLLATWGNVYPVAYRYDAFGRMTNMLTLRDTTVTVDDYDDVVANLGSFDRTAWLYDEATGLLTNKLYADDLGPSYSYTPDGKLSSREWARGEEAWYRYNPVGLLTNIEYSAANTPDIIFRYDRLGRQTNVVDGTGLRGFVYDSDTLQLHSETNWIGGIVRAYDGYGRSGGFAVDATHQVGYSYGDMGRVSGVTWTNAALGGGLRTVDYSHAANSDLVAGWTTGAGALSVGRAYEPYRNLIAGVSNRWDGTVISKYMYVNDELGRRTNRVDSGTQFASPVGNDFGYNARSELTSADMGSGEYGYAYDPIGNRLTASHDADEWTYLANRLNQYTNIDDGASADLLYDPDGNLTNDGERVYFWNGENRLRRVQPVTPASDDLRYTYGYDYMGRRYQIGIEQWTGSMWSPREYRYFLYDGWNLGKEIVWDMWADTVSTNWYVWGLDLSGTLQGAGGIGGLLAKVTDSGAYFATYDANGNVSEYIDESDTNVVAHYEYGPYGQLTASSGTMADDFPHRFSTKYYDSPTSDSLAAGGLYYYGLRS